jgi:hypothetical protein
MSSRYVVAILTDDINQSQNVLSLKVGKIFASSVSTSPTRTILEFASLCLIAMILCCDKPDIKDLIVFISISSQFLVRFGCNASFGSHLSGNRGKTGKCTFSQSLGTCDSKCTIVPVVSNGMKTPLPENSMPKGALVAKGLSWTVSPDERTWFGLINECCSCVPNHSISSSTKR